MKTRRRHRDDEPILTPEAARFSLRLWGPVLTSLALATLGLFFLWKVRSALAPFLVALLIATVIDPVLQKLERRGWPRRRSVPLLFLLFLMIGTGVVLWIFPYFLDQLYGLTINFSKSVTETQAQIDRIMQQPMIRRIPESIRTPITQQLTRAAEFLPQALSSVTAFFFAAVSRVLWLVITLLATFYMLLDLPEINRSFMRWIPFHSRKRVFEVGSDVAAVFASYIRGLVIVCLLNGMAVAIVLSLMRVPNALAIGAIGGTLYMVPYVGALVNVAISGLVALFAYNVTKAIWVVAVMLILHQIFDYGITPRILGKQVGLHPLASLFAMVTAGTLFGITGVILAVPVAASIVVVLRHLYPRIMGPPPT
jgi:predicted PurR-regulated permease PerM